MSGMMAWHGTVQMKEAKWTDAEGSTVSFFLPMEGQHERRNPFERFTKRRKGRAGTRFMMACHRFVGDETGRREPLYEDEVMLAGWNDSQTTGHTVKFWLCSDVLGHPFEGCERNKDKFAVSLVEIDDDQEPVDQKMRSRVEKASIRPSERLSYAAAMLCKNEGFWTWINDMSPDAVNIGGEDGARIWLCMMCHIDSRAQLDDPNEGLAIETFHDIRHKFLAWQGGVKPASYPAEARRW